MPPHPPPQGFGTEPKYAAPLPCAQKQGMRAEDRPVKYRILTNNSTISRELPGFAVTRIPGGIEAVYAALGELLQNGYALVSSPLPANVPLIRSPIRSVILEKSARRYDAPGLIALEKARERTAVLGVIDEERTRRDLEFIDRDQLERAIGQLAELT